MSSTMVQGETGWEANASGFRILSIKFDEQPVALFNHVGNVGHLHAWLDMLLGICAGRPVHLSGAPDGIVVELAFFAG